MRWGGTRELEPRQGGHRLHLGLGLRGGTYDLGVDYDGDDGPPGRCSIDEAPYEILLGPCPLGPDGKSSELGITLPQAVQARLEQQ